MRIIYGEESRRKQLDNSKEKNLSCLVTYGVSSITTCLVGFLRMNMEGFVFDKTSNEHNASTPYLGYE